VDNGRTTLVSPNLNLSAITDPHVAFYYYYVNDAGSNPGEDPLVVSVSNDGGSTWVQVASILVSNYKWERYDFRVEDFVPKTSTVKVRFIAQDVGAGGSIVEAAVDDFGYYTPPVQSGVGDGPAAQLPPDAGKLLAGPNPFQAAVDLNLQLPGPTQLSVKVFDATGRLVRTLHEGPAAADWSVRWDGTDQVGQRAPGGIYFVRASGDNFQRVARLVRIR
jgi:hypothetical protein